MQSAQQVSTSKNHQYIPNEAFLYFPQGSDVKLPGDRLVFDGNTQYDQEDLKRLEEFKAYLRNSGKTYNSSWTDNFVMRMVYAAFFKPKDTLETINEIESWRRSAIPIQMDSRLQNYLNSGLLYVCGRDCKYRPIVVMNISKIDPKQIEIELLTKFFTFWFEFIIDEMMLPGQLETWNFIVDVQNMKFGPRTIQQVTKVFKHLQDHYKCRLFSLYIVNAPSSIYVPWKVVKKMLDDITLSKISFSKDASPEALFRIANPAQVEQRYGGTAPNITQFWPPVLNFENIRTQNSPPLISKEEYASRYQQGLLKNMKICQEFIDSAANSQKAAPTADVVKPSTQPVNQTGSLSHLDSNTESQKITQNVQTAQVPASQDSLVGDLKRGGTLQKESSIYATVDTLPESFSKQQSALMGSLMGASADVKEIAKPAMQIQDLDFEGDYVDSMDEMDGYVVSLREFEASFLPEPSQDRIIKIYF